MRFFPAGASVRPSDITLEQADDSVLVCVSADRNPVEKVKVHTASNETNPALRCWEMVPLQFREGNRYYFRLYPEKGIKKTLLFSRKFPILTVYRIEQHRGENA